MSSHSLRNSSASKAISKAAFYAALALQQEIDTRSQLSALAADAAQTARQLANVGQADAPDVLQSEVEQEQAALDILAARHRYIAAFHQLTALAGQPDLPLTRLAGDLTASPAQPPSLDSILEQSPAVQRANQAVNAAEAQLRSARREDRSLTSPSVPASSGITS